jgi:multidrug transporter EmrE-like cation transporter
MLTRIMIVITWLLSFSLLNVQGKILVEKAPPFCGNVSSILKFALTSTHVYLLLILYAACAIVYLISLRLMPMSIAGPVFNTVAALATFLLGVFWFGENISFMKIMGLGLCLAGVFLLFAQG